MKVSELSDQYIASFDPKEYLQECYAAPDDEFRFGIKFLTNALKKLPPNLFALEFGGGPTLHTVAALAPYASQIHFADFVPASLNEVRLWLNNAPNAYNWHPFIKIILEGEGLTATPQAIAQREAEMRQKVTGVMACNALSSTPLGENAGQYNLVLAPYCTDVAASTVEEWVQVIKNVSSLVAPGGWLLVGITTGATLNTVGQQVFSCVDLTNADIQNGFAAAGFNPNTFYLDHCPVPAGREYTGLTNAIAQKPINQPMNRGTMTSHSDYVTTFDPREYLKNFYVEPDPEDRFVIKFMVDALRKMPPNLRMLELGGGPTLFAVATLAPQASEIHFCDFVPANLNEVQLWLDNKDDAFNWYPYIKMVLEEEGKTVTPQAIAERAAEMRQKVTLLTNCNAAAPEPLGQHVEKKYDLVVAQASTDVAANTVEAWMQILSNISNSLLTSNGWLLISVITGTSGYTVGQERFHCLHLTNDDIYNGYMAAGFEPDTFHLETMNTSGDREYFGISTAVAQKIFVG